jgi:sugar/nucleoside kinase (ribokinase family)
MTRLQNDILVVGSVALDTVETPFGASRDALGGSAVYFSLAARYFNSVHLLGVVGTDFPDRYRELLAERQVNVQGLMVAEGQTFRWSGKFSKHLKDPKTLATHLNVFQQFKPTLNEAQKDCPVVFLGNIDPELQSEVLSSLTRPKLVACDTHQYWIKSKRSALKELLSKVDVFFINEEEARKLTREVSLLKAARTLQSWGPRVIVIKKGEHGANMLVSGQHMSFPAFPVEDVMDPTGAGDSFAGGFLGYLSGLHDWHRPAHLKRAVLYGSVMASFNVEDFSTHRLAALDEKDLHARYRQFVESISVEESVPASVAA